MDVLLQLLALAAQFFGPLWPLVWALVRIVAVVAILLGGVAYLTLAERKIIGWMQIRIGPNRVGPLGLLQPLADGAKLALKELIVPTNANKVLFVVGPIIVLAVALAPWAVIPFQKGWVISNIDAGMLYLMGLTSLGIYGVIVAGWASNSKYAFLGAMRSSAQMISYELSMGFSLVAVLMISGSLNLTDIVDGQAKGWFAAHGVGFLSWNWLPLLPMFLVYLASGFAETNRAPFDVVEGESEIVAGHMVEYSGMGFGLFFMGEYANMILISTLTSLFFLGGWLSPVGFVPDGFHWLVAKVVLVLFLYLWVRATFPRFRYDQIMRLGWKVFIPLTLGWILLVGIWLMSPWSIWR